MNEDLLFALLIAAVVVLLLYNFYPPEGASMPNRNVMNNMQHPLSQEQNPNSTMKKIKAKMTEHRTMPNSAALNKKIKPAPQTISRLGGRIGFTLGNAGK